MAEMELIVWVVAARWKLQSIVIVVWSLWPPQLAEEQTNTGFQEVICKSPESLSLSLKMQAIRDGSKASIKLLLLRNSSATDFYYPEVSQGAAFINQSLI